MDLGRASLDDGSGPLGGGGGGGAGLPPGDNGRCTAAIGPVSDWADVLGTVPLNCVYGVSTGLNLFGGDCGLGAADCGNGLTCGGNCGI